MKNKKKYCKNGHLFVKENTYFYRGSKICRKCRSKSVKEYLANHPEIRKKENEKMFKIYKENGYFKTEKYKSRASKNVKKWILNNKEKVKVHKETNKAIKVGKLKRKICKICGALNTDAHHPDYSKPLKVIWLCRKHHKLLHKKLKELD